MSAERDKEQQNKSENGKTWMSSILLILLALVSISLTSLAWFTIADNTRLRGISMDVTTGPSLRFDLDPHEDFAQYVKTLSFADISARVAATQGYSISQSPMSPVTTNDCSEFYFENGSVAPSGDGTYITFTLHFMAKEDLYVHLTSANSGSKTDGTSVSSATTGLTQSMRIAFVSEDKVAIYDAGAAGDYENTVDGVTTFGLYDAANMTYTDANTLFFIEKDVDKTVQVYIWLEGTDEYCTNVLKGSDYAIALRFQGTDEKNNTLLSE